MVKLIALLKRKPGITREEFKQRWLYEHTKLSSRLTDCLEYRINICIEAQPEDQKDDPLYDGTAELWWESVEKMEASFGNDIAKIAGDDADSFCDVRIHLYSEEYLVVRNGQSVQPPQPVQEL